MATVHCADCGENYDADARLAICPHEEIRQTELARGLVGRRVRFAHRPEGIPAALVTRATIAGMVELEGYTGEFAPHLFVLAD